MSIAMGKQIAIMMFEESTLGTMIEPSDASLSNGVYITPITAPTFTQERETFDDEQIRDTRSRLTPIAGRYLAGTWSFDTYIKPSGTAGTAPQERLLCKGLLGQQDTSAGSMVVYRCANTLPSFTMWLKEGHTVQVITGALVNQGVFSVDGRNPGRVSWSGMCLRRIWTGTADLGAAISDTTSTTVRLGAGQSDRFNFYSTAYSIIQIDNEIMKVTAIPDASTLTVQRAYKGSTAATHSAGSNKVVPYWPSNPQEIGSPVHGRLGFCQWKGGNDASAVDIPTLTNEITITNNIRIYEEEKINEDWPSDYGLPTPREVTARMTAYFREGQAQRLAEARDFDLLKYYVKCGNTAGSIFWAKMDNVRITAPNTSGDEERIQEINVRPFASSTTANDEVVLIYQ